MVSWSPWTRSIGTLGQGLRDLKIAGNTLVWFTSDNGGLPDIDYGPEYLGVHPDSTGHLRGFKKDEVRQGRKNLRKKKGT